jgi:GNAT superfamily N-acetyltransferase
MLSGRLSIRPARAADAEMLEALQRLALCRLAASHYPASHIEAVLRFIGTLDPALIEDGTYYVAEVDGLMVGCGGWSFRARILGNDQTILSDPSRKLEAHSDAARIRAVFVHPDWTRHGIARRLVGTAEAAAREAGFRHVTLVSTLNAEPLYRSLGYRSIERMHLALPDLVRLPAVRMAKELAWSRRETADAQTLADQAA